MTIVTPFLFPYIRSDTDSSWESEHARLTSKGVQFQCRADQNFSSFTPTSSSCLPTPYHHSFPQKWIAQWPTAGNTGLFISHSVNGTTCKNYSKHNIKVNIQISVTELWPVVHPCLHLHNASPNHFLPKITLFVTKPCAREKNKQQQKQGQGRNRLIRNTFKSSF